MENTYADSIAKLVQDKLGHSNSIIRINNAIESLTALNGHSAKPEIQTPKKYYGAKSKGSITMEAGVKLYFIKNKDAHSTQDIYFGITNLGVKCFKKSLGASLVRMVNFGAIKRVSRGIYQGV